MQELVLFGMTFVLIFLIYQVFIVRKAIRKKDPKKPMEIRYLESRYHIHTEDAEYRRLLLAVSVVSSFDIALLVSIVSLISNYFLSILAALLLVVPLILVSYHVIGSYYKMKGRKKND